MGGFFSKDPGQYDYIAQCLQDGIKDHDNNLKAYEETVKAHTLAVDQLTKCQGKKHSDYEHRQQTDAADYRLHTDGADYRQQTGGADYGQPTGGADYRQQTGGPDYRKQTGISDYRQQTGVADYRQQTGSPDYRQQTGGPDYRQQTGDADYRQQTGSPDYRQQTGDPDYRQKTGGPDYRQQTGGADYRQQAGGPDYRQQTGDPDYRQQTGGPDYRQQTGGADYRQQTGSPDYRQQTGGADYTQKNDGDEQSEEDKTHRDRQILANIQGILLLQCDIVKSNFKHLKRCLRDTIQDVVETKNLTEPWNQLLQELEYYHPQKNKSTVDVSLQKYSSESIDKQFKLLKETIDSHCQHVREYESDIKHRQHTQKDQKKLAAKDDEIKDLKENIRRYKSEIETQKVGLQDASTKAIEWKDKYNNLERQISELQTTNRRLEEQIRMKVKQKVPIQLYYLRNDDLMTTVVSELHAMLNTHTSLHDFEVEILHCKQAKDLKPDIPVLALCINASRLGTDATSSISGLRNSDSPKTALLIFHHKDVHAIPSQRSERMLTGQEFKDLGGIFDLVFLRGKGIYPCNLNEEALKGITRFIKR